jgi:hypothetical protein
VFTHPRESWQSPAQPVTGPPINWSTITTVVIHYTAARDCPEGDYPGVYAAFLRSMQADYLRNRGYSLGYSVAVSTVGESWEIRGDDIKPAATKGHNDTTYAILVTVDGDAPASPAAVAEVRRLIAAAEVLAGRPLAIKGHGELGATACPGAGLRAQIAAGTFRPVTPPPPPTPGDDMPFMWRDARYANVFLVGSCPAQNISGKSMEMLTAKGVPLVVDRHDQFLATCLHQSGLDASALVKA